MQERKAQEDWEGRREGNLRLGCNTSENQFLENLKFAYLVPSSWWVN